MGPARRWYQSGSLTGLGVRLGLWGTRPGRGGSSLVPLRAGGGGDRTWREPVPGRREGSVRSGEARRGGADLEKPGVAAPGGGGRAPRPLPAPLRVPESRRDESAGQGKHRRPNTRPGSPPGAPLHPLPPAAGACSGSCALAPPDSHPKCDGKFLVFFFFWLGVGRGRAPPAAGEP